MKTGNNPSTSTVKLKMSDIGFEHFFEPENPQTTENPPNVKSSGFSGAIELRKPKRMSRSL